MVPIRFKVEPVDIFLSLQKKVETKKKMNTTQTSCYNTYVKHDTTKDKQRHIQKTGGSKKATVEPQKKHANIKGPRQGKQAQASYQNSPANKVTKSGKEKSPKLQNSKYARTDILLRAQLLMKT
jgi:hypothetical protein